VKLHVCRVPGGNFGDDLNDILWPALFPDILDTGNPATIFGIGSILGGDHDPDAPKIVLGSGLGYKKSKPLDASWDIRWVRGRLSTQALGISADFALGDSALLWPELARAGAAGDRVGLIPHHASWESFDWETIAGQAGLLAINPKDSPDGVRRQLLRCQSVLTESLHGAIFADCLRIPWQAMALSYRFNRFKWKDWLSITGLGFAHASAPFPLVDEVKRMAGLKNRLASALRRDDDVRLNSLRPGHPARASECAAVVDFLGRTAGSDNHRCLSNAEALDRIRDRMHAACRRFALDYGLRCTL
jgi:hypothetical protein